MIFDEAHAIIASANFRDVMEQVYRLMEQRVPITFITATLPPRLLKHFCLKVELPEKFSCIRATTNRPEHIYTIKAIQGYSRDATMKAMARFIAQLSQRLEGEDRAIIFVRFTHDGKSLSNSLYNCPFISSEMESESLRVNAIRQWESGETGGLLIGTSSLIQGLHYNHVRFVIFAGAPWGLMDLVQGAGRGGRDGKPANVVVISSNEETQPIVDPADPQCQAEIEEWLAIQQCRRVILSLTMDGQKVTCMDLPGASKCDVCQSHQPIIDDAWECAISNDPPHVPKNVNLQPFVNMQQDASTPISVLPIQSRVPNQDVIWHSTIMAYNRNLLDKNTQKTFTSILKAGPTCSICWFLNVQKSKMEKPERSHPNLRDCARYQGNEVKFKKFYDFNSPKKSAAKVSYHNISPHPPLIF